MQTFKAFCTLFTLLEHPTHPLNLKLGRVGGFKTAN